MSNEYEPKIGDWPWEPTVKQWPSLQFDAQAYQLVQAYGNMPTEAQQANQLKLSQYKTWTTQSPNWLTPSGAFATSVPEPIVAAPPPPPAPHPIVEISPERKFDL